MGGERYLITNWKPDESTKETLTATFTSGPSGTHKLAVGLFLNQNEQNPIYRLGILGRTAQGWYVLSDKVEMRD